jgi:uncharacterized membrane protein YdjX (TVP38/TMEM64 family)
VQQDRVTMSRNRTRVVAVAIGWTACVVAWLWYLRASDLSTTEAAQQFVDTASGAWWAALAFLALSVARPFVLFPATLLTVAAGLLFGVVGGVALGLTGALASALVGHVIGASFSGAAAGDGRIARWRTRLAANGFEAVLLMRLVFLPYDLVNYGCGYLRVRRTPFLLATAIGSLPGTLSFVLLGMSLTDLTMGVGGIDRTALSASVVLIAASIVGSRLVQRRARLSES